MQLPYILSLYVLGALSVAMPTSQTETVKRDWAYCRELSGRFDVGINNMMANSLRLPAGTVRHSLLTADQSGGF